MDVFTDEAAARISQADVVLVNPPFLSLRRSDVEQEQASFGWKWGGIKVAPYPPPDWLLLSDIATVRAGPSVRSLKHALPTGQSPMQIAAVPAGYDRSQIWCSDSYRVVDWDELGFAARRNMAHQGRPGFVYKLAAKRFVTAILPAGHAFLSNCLACAFAKSLPPHTHATPKRKCLPAYPNWASKLAMLWKGGAA